MTAEELDTPIIKPGDTVLGKYRVERLLGEGGMGTVVAIRHTELDELFAMKVMKPGVMNQPGSVERFIREARAGTRAPSWCKPLQAADSRALVRAAGPFSTHFSTESVNNPHPQRR